LSIFNAMRKAIYNYDLEEKKVIEFIAHYFPKGSILDIGCGYGRILELIPADRYEALGIDLNDKIVEACKAKGLNCFTPTIFKDEIDLKFDVMLMLHVIEHMSPYDCFNFIDGYLDRLKEGGILIIATPILTDYFFEDFDHIKPYYPVGINMVFSGNDAQVQYYSRNKLKMIDLWYKRYFYRSINSKSVYFPTGKFLYTLSNLLFALLFKISLGLVGKKDGWVGVFRKVQ